MKLFFSHIASACLFISSGAPAHAADGPKQPIPDLTKGEELTRVNKRWVGPLGIYCGAWRQRQRTTDETPFIRQLLVLEVEEGSPADGVLQVGDVILGADGTGAAKVPLSKGSEIWPMIPIAEAINEAEARNPAILKLLVWRKGVTKTVSIKLVHLGRYSETAPYHCSKSQNILRRGIKALYEENKLDQAGLGILCLLAADDPSNPENEKYQAKAKEWVHQLEVGGSPWFTGPKLMALSEYYLKTGDKTIFPKLEAQAEEVARGLSWFGTCGHRWCEKREDGSDNGRIAGYGPITASGALNYLGLSMARKAGVQSEVVEKSHKAQRIFFGHYAFKSGMGYGEMPYGIGGGVDDYNAKQANSGLALGMDEGGEEKAKFFSKMATLSTIGKRQYAHGGSFFGQVFHPLGAVQGGEKAANLKFREIRWHLDLKRSWDHTRIYDSSGNGYTSHHHGATALLFFAAPLKQIYLTGRGQKDSLKFTDSEFQGLLEIKNFEPSNATVDELLSVMSRYDGMLRGDVANELVNRIKATPDAPENLAIMDKLIAIAANENSPTHGRVGACCALMNLKNKAPDPLKELKNVEIAKTMIDLLKDEEAYIRFAAIRAMQKLDASAVQPYGNDILDAIIATGRPTFPLNEEDPLQWAHGEMGVLLSSVFSKSLDGLDRDRLIPALRSLLQTPNGGARGTVTRLLDKLSKKETLQVADMLVDNIRTSPPGNAMGGGAAALNSQSILAEYMFEEALPLSALYGVQAAIKNKIPQKYGKAAMQIGAIEQFLQAIGDNILIEAVDARAVTEGIEKGEFPESELSKLKSIARVKAATAALKLPAAKTQLMVEASNYVDPKEVGTIYTWRKLHGAGKVSFEPNGSGHSKTTTVSFIDKKPGQYRFEVTMSDALGLNVVRQTVAVDLFDTSGKLPKNQPPRAKSQSLDAAPGEAVPVTFTGTDPDGDNLGFVVSQMPMHGILRDANGHVLDFQAAIDGPVTYTALFGYEGSDRLTFMVLDGQGKTAKGSIDFKISGKSVGVAVYEGFDYAAGKVHGQEGGSSFGFAGPWQGSRGEEGTKYEVLRTNVKNTSSASLTHPDLPSSGGRLFGQKHTTLSRELDSKVLNDLGLLENGGELWFSVFIDKPDLTFELKGPEMGLGFKTRSHKRTIHATLNGEEAGEARNPWSRSANLRFPETKASMVIGCCKWGKTEKDPDILTIHRVFDAPTFGPMFLENPACTLEEVIDQKTLNSIFTSFDNNKALDEIRIGPTLNSVMVGTQPLRK